MYQEVILEESKSSANRLYAIDDPNKSHQFNPSCGDDITVSVNLSDTQEKEKTVKNIKWAGEGCSISLASASIMSKLLVNKTVEQALEICEVFSELMNSRGKGLENDKLDLLEDASAFIGTSKFPARIKCALLAWVAFKGAIASNGISSGFSEHAKNNG